MDIVLEFINHYQSLSSSEKMKLGGYFNSMTGGKLSAYNSPTLVAVALVQVETERGVELLGIKRNIMPKIGELALPGGFVDHMEEPKSAAAREVLEETGLVTTAEDYTVFSDMKVTGSNNILVFMLNKNVYPESVMSSLTINSEVSEFALINCETPLAFPLHEESARAYLSTLRPADKPKR